MVAVRGRGQVIIAKKCITLGRVILNQGFNEKNKMTDKRIEEIRKEMDILFDDLGINLK
jgi:DNA-directed RNA polymerase subunit N (RpoN/RPB10)